MGCLDGERGNGHGSRISVGHGEGDVECGGMTPLWNWETCLPVQSADMSAHSTQMARWQFSFLAFALICLDHARLLGFLP